MFKNGQYFLFFRLVSSKSLHFVELPKIVRDKMSRKDQFMEENKALSRLDFMFCRWIHFLYEKLGLAIIEQNSKYCQEYLRKSYFSARLTASGERLSIFSLCFVIPSQSNCISYKEIQIDKDFILLGD